MPRYLEIISMDSLRCWAKYCCPFKLARTKPMTSAGFILDLLHRRADAAGRIAGQIIARIGQLGEAVTVKDQLARLGQQTSGDAAGAQRGDEFFGTADDDQGRVFVLGDSMLGKNSLRQDIRAAA